MEDPDFWDHQESAEKKAKELSNLKNTLSNFDELADQFEELTVLAELGEEEEDRETIREARQGLQKLNRELSRLETRVLLDGPNDECPAFLSIQAGAGGVDACDWAQILWRMYTKYLDDRGYDYEIVDIREGEEAGLKTVTAHVKDDYAFGFLKSEIGVHRLIRISPFDAGGRRHTSFCAVDLSPDLEDIEIEINEEDIRVDFYRASGAGGQHVNMTDSAVRITYLPEDIQVQCQNERSQHLNRKMAMKMLRSKLYSLKEKEREEELKQLYGEKGEISWGNQIRSYYFDPQERVKDHRTDLETHDVESVLDGEIQPFIDAYLRSDHNKNS